MRKDHLVAINHADVFAPHSRFRFNARFFELLDAIIKVSLDEESPKIARLAACFR